MVEIGRLLALVGVLVAILGLALWGLGRIGFHGLPGDLRIETKNVRLYFPIVTCIVLSLLLTALMWLWHWLSRR